MAEKNISCDIVIHNAGKAHAFRRAETDNESLIKYMFRGLKIYFKCRKIVPNQFIFMSSVSVYGLKYGVNVDGHVILNAKDWYGLSKMQAERIAINWCNNNNVVCTILLLL